MKSSDNHFMIIISIALALLIFSSNLYAIQLNSDYSTNGSEELPGDLTSIADSIQQSRNFPKKSTRSIGKSNEIWPMFKNTANRQGISNSIIPGSGPMAPNVVWTNKTAATCTSPVVGYGKVYLTTNDGQVFSFAENSGHLLWQKQVSFNNPSGLTTPAISNGHLVIFSDSNRQLFSLNAFNGELNWTVNLPGLNDSSRIVLTNLDRPILVYKGNIIFGSSDRYIYCINETTGKLVWSFKTDEGLTLDYGITGGVTAVGNSVYFGASDGYLYALDLLGLENGNQGILSEKKFNETDGDVLWKYFTGDSISSTPAIYNNYIYTTVGVHNSTYGDYKIYKIYCIYRNNGSLAWDYKVQDHIVSSPSIFNNKVIFGSLDGRVYCLPTDSNTSVWSYSISNPIWSSPAVTSEKLVIGSLDSKLYCLYTQTGLLVWDLQLNSDITGSPALANGRIYICSKTGKLYSIGPADIKPPQVLTTWPGNNANNIPVSSEISIQFDERLDPHTVKPNSVNILDKFGNLIPLDISYNDETIAATITPKKFLNVSSKYTVSVLTLLSDFAGNTLDGNENGIPQGSPDDDFKWSFTTSSNRPPELSNAMVSPTYGTLDTTFSFSVLYSDKDNDQPSSNGKDIILYINDYSQSYQLSLNDTPQTPIIWHDGNYIDGEQYIFTTKLPSTGIYNYWIWCSDGTDWNETNVSSQPIIPGPPILDNIPDFTIKEDEIFTLNLTEYLTDPDTPLEKLNIQVNTSYAQVDGLSIKFQYPNSFTYPGGSRYDILNITVSDSEFFTSQKIQIWIESVNDPPIIRSIPTQLVVEKIPSSLDLKDYVYDIDNPFNDLIFKVITNYSYIQDGRLIMNYPTGNQMIKTEFNVSDGLAWSIGEINVSVVSSDVSFVIRDIGTIETVEDVEISLDIKEYLIMVTGKYSNLRIESSSEYASVSELEINLLYNDTFNYPIERSTEDVKITVSDISKNYNQVSNINVRVTSVNDAPTLLNGQVEPEFGNITQDFNFEVYYRDIDGSEKYKIYVIIDGDQIEMEWVSNSKLDPTGAKFTYTSKMGAGYHNYYFKCDDGSKAPNSQFNTDIDQFYITANLDSKFIDPGRYPYQDKTTDTDKDGMPNYWEIQYGLDPLDITDALDDRDNDEFNNLLEYLGHDGLSTGNDSTDPTDTSDTPRIQKDNGDQDLIIPQWLIFVVLIIAIIIGLNVLYFILTGRSIGRSMKIPKMMLHHEVRSAHPYLERGDHDTEEDYDDSKLDHDLDEQNDSDINDDALTDIEPEFKDDRAMTEVPVTEVDLTTEEQPFLESEEVLEEFSGGESKSEGNVEGEVEDESEHRSENEHENKNEHLQGPKHESSPEQDSAEDFENQDTNNIEPENTSEPSKKEKEAK